MRRVGAVAVVAAAARLEWRMLRREPSTMFAVWLVPVQTLGYLAIFRFGGRADLDLYAVIAPAVIALWALALMLSGEVIANERDNQSLEAIAAAPARLELVMVGRVVVITLASWLALPLSMLTGWVFFGVPPLLAEPGVFVLTYVAMSAATIATALLFAVFFVNSRSPRIFQNSLSYPFYVLGGVLVPVALYPEWVQVLARGVYLSWSADLLRASATGNGLAGWPWRIGVILALGLMTYLVARGLLALTLRNARKEGKLGLT
ncbi:ABC transporter permease [Microbacterium sp. I2]|uniref:ABC transporter permease n=1 Tax=Microbacterium sp. I2 TaxID=3391826 RepID=UPI003EDAAF1A